MYKCLCIMYISCGLGITGFSAYKLMKLSIHPVVSHLQIQVDNCSFCMLCGLKGAVMSLQKKFSSVWAITKNYVVLNEHVALAGVGCCETCGSGCKTCPTHLTSPIASDCYSAHSEQQIFVMLEVC